MFFHVGHILLLSGETIGLVERPGSTCGGDVPCLYGDFRQNRVVMDHVMWRYMAYSRRRNDIVEDIVDE